jgi:hypothetical protein
MRLSTDVVEAVNNPPLRTKKVDIAKEESHLPLGKILPSGHEPYFTLFPHKKDNQPILNGLTSLTSPADLDLLQYFQVLGKVKLIYGTR